MVTVAIVTIEIIKNIISPEVSDQENHKPKFRCDAISVESADREQHCREDIEAKQPIETTCLLVISTTNNS